MSFTAHTQAELQAFNIIHGQTYLIEYVDKDYFNADEMLVKGSGIAVVNDNTIYFNVVDDYGMDKLVMKARILNS